MAEAPDDARTIACPTSSGWNGRSGSSPRWATARRRTTTEVYAREQIILHERQQTEIVVQALRIGDIGIATTPTETYAITGLKIKAASPLPQTMVIELANGGDGYIPPPEQHLLGGYNTWAARSAGLEVMAEPKIAEAAHRVCWRKSAASRGANGELSDGPAARAILDAEAARVLAPERIHRAARGRRQRPRSRCGL